jgi:hypothetical protein
MSDDTVQRRDIEISAKAREALLGFVDRDGKARYVRIHVGRG